MPDFNLIVNCSMFVDFEVNFFQDETMIKKPRHLLSGLSLFFKKLLAICDCSFLPVIVRFQDITKPT